MVDLPGGGRGGAQQVRSMRFGLQMGDVLPCCVVDEGCQVLGTDEDGHEKHIECTHLDAIGPGIHQSVTLSETLCLLSKSTRSRRRMALESPVL